MTTKMSLIPKQQCQRNKTLVKDFTLYSTILTNNGHYKQNYNTSEFVILQPENLLRELSKRIPDLDFENIYRRSMTILEKKFDITSNRRYLEFFLMMTLMNQFSTMSNDEFVKAVTSALPTNSEKINPWEKN